VVEPTGGGDEVESGRAGHRRAPQEEKVLSSVAAARELAVAASDGTEETQGEEVALVEGEEFIVVREELGHGDDGGDSDEGEDMTLDGLPGLCLTSDSEDDDDDSDDSDGGVGDRGVGVALDIPNGDDVVRVRLGPPNWNEWSVGGGGGMSVRPAYVRPLILEPEDDEYYTNGDDGVVADDDDVDDVIYSGRPFDAYDDRVLEPGDEGYCSYGSDDGGEGEYDEGEEGDYDEGEESDGDDSTSATEAGTAGNVLEVEIIVGEDSGIARPICEGSTYVATEDGLEEYATMDSILAVAIREGMSLEDAAVMREAMLEVEAEHRAQAQ
jgi:hypothetical protein